MSARQPWLAAGLRLLAGEGARVLTIERLCDEVQRTKGSFYHHFGSIDGYYSALLDHFEESETDRYVALAEQAPGGSARNRLDRLRAVMTTDDGALERGVRAWAAQDDVARAALLRIDDRRIRYVEGLIAEITGDPREAADVAKLTYLLLIGSYHVLPPLPIADVQRLWRRVLGPYVSD